MTTLTTRDRKLLERLDWYGVLSTRQVIETTFPEIRKTTVLRRLRKLEEGEWIRRIQGLSDGSFAWCLGVSGEEEAGEGERLPRINRLTLDHDVRLTDIRMALESVGLDENWVLDRSMRRRLYSRRRSRDEERSLIPDAIFSATTHAGNVRAIAVECELNPKKLARYEKIFRAYRARSEITMVWYFVNSRSFGNRLHQKWNDGMSRRSENDASFGVSLIDDVLRDPRKAPIYFWSGPNAIDEFFQLPERAHSAAQGVSTEELNAA